VSLKSATILGPWMLDAKGRNVSAIESVWRPNGSDWLYPCVQLRDTGQPNVVPSPNVCTWTVDSVDEAALTALEQDPQGRFVILSETDAIT